MITDLGYELIIIGAAFLALGLLKWPARASGLTSSLIKELQMPEYERRARMYCLAYGMPVEQWERFSARAIGEIITRRR